MRILLTCALGRTAKSVVEMLKNNPSHEEIYLVGVDMDRNEERETYYDAFYQVPPIVELKEYINCLIDICEKEKIEVLLPWSIFELEELFREQSRFKNTKILLSSPLNAITILSHKSWLYTYLTMRNYPVLDFDVVLPDTIDEANEVLATHTDKEWVLKLSFGEGGRGISLLPKGTTSITLPNDYDVYVIQERVNDRYPYKFDALVLNGECISSYVRRDTWEEKIIESEIIDCPKFSDMCKKLLKQLNYSGLVNIQSYKIDDEYYIVDVNPRMWGPIAISYEAGGNILWWAIEQLVYGKITTLTEHRVGTKYNPYPKREITDDKIGKDKRTRLY